MSLSYVRERIRTLGLLVRSQTLYPTELHVRTSHILATLLILHHILFSVNQKSIKIRKGSK